MKNYCYTCMNEITDGNYCRYCGRENTADEVVYRLLPGTILNNKYLVGNCLGEGGFGITYIGRDLTLDMRVAIKEFFPNGYVNRNNTFNQNVTASTENQKTVFYKGKERFLEEARRLAKFAGEPGIVGVRDYFEANGTAYIIMDYLDGVNLSSYIRNNGTFSAQDIFRLMLPITHSLKRIHNAGVIHRDISPDNIMYLRDGTLKLMDFGSARYFNSEQKEMSVLLKQGYSPEEQYRKNGDQGPWTDVYGLCATMYRCITGKIPDDALDRLRSDSLVPPSQLGVSIPQSMEMILMYGLAVFRENRCQDMDELSSLIERALAQEEVNVRRTNNEYGEVYRTQMADQYYKTRLEKEFTREGSPQPYAAPESGVTGQKRGPNKAVVISVIVASSVVIVATIVLLIFLFMPKTSDHNNTPTFSSSAVSQSSAQNDAQDGDLKVVVPACENKSLEYAETALEGAGLMVKTEYEYSSEVEKDCVIRQSAEANTEVASGATITLTVSKGAEASPYDYSQKLTVTASSGSSYATATLYEWKDGKWSEQAQYSATVAKNGIGSTHEGSSTSPVGVHNLGVVLSWQNIDTNMNTYKVTSSTGVVSDVNSSCYNQIMESYEAPSLNKFDLVGEEFSYAAIFIEFNGNGFSSDGVVSGGGSAIFVRGKSGSLSPTAGDVDISENDMKDLISRLDADKKPVIELTVD